MQLNSDDRNKILTEISECQSRILQVFVPTIIAVGLISIADKDKFALITLFSSFAILFGSSLYVTNLSYKIFRNATFLKVINENNKTNEDEIYWENALSLFHTKIAPPKVIGYETKTIAVIYMMFSIVFIFMFFSINLFFSLVCGILLLLIAYKMLTLPNASNQYYENWKEVLKHY